MKHTFKTSLVLMVTMILVLGMSTVAFAAQVNSNLTQEQQEWLKSNITVDGDNIESTDMNVKGKLSTTAPSGDYCMLVLNDGAIVYWSSTNDSSLSASITRATNNTQVTQKMEGLVNNLA